MTFEKLIRFIKPPARVFIIGNGGSYANAVHIANDLLAHGIMAFTLDPATLTACANDHGYEHVFAHWLETVASRDDVLIALSGSGKSPNILKALSTAENLGMKIWREFGVERNFGMQDAEEYQISFGHELMRRVRGDDHQ
jgi:D-sedoheptulose 7-phosphate isomerase